MSRIYTELTDDQLIKMFNSMAKIKIKYIFFIPAQLLTFKSLIIEIYLRIKPKLFKKKLVFVDILDPKIYLQACGKSITKHLKQKTVNPFY